MNPASVTKMILMHIVFCFFVILFIVLRFVSGGIEFLKPLDGSDEARQDDSWGGSCIV